MYNKEFFSPHIKYLKYTSDSLRALEAKFGPATISLGSSIIEVDLIKSTWRICADFEWLYRNMPPFISVDEL